MSTTTWLTDRHKTAIGRSSLSMPARQALLDGVLRPEWTALDFGSGRGGDAARLRHLGIETMGWDPQDGAARPDQPRDVVTLTYVINVIEDPAERRRVLEDAWSLAQRCLVVSTRLTWERKQVNGAAVSDGTVTRRNTFQRLYTPAELRSLVEQATGMRAISPVPGVAYAFRRDEDRLAYIARKVAPDQVWQEGDDAQSAVAAVVDFLEQRGRMPELEETPHALLPLLRNVTGRQLARLAAQEADPDRVAEGRKRSILNVLLLLGISVFDGRSQVRDLSPPIQADVRAFFESYKEACSRADRLLLKLRDDTYLRNVMRNSVGKMTPTAIYVHRRAADRMPVLLKLYEHCGAVAVGRPADWDLIKLSHEGRSVSWLRAPACSVNVLFCPEEPIRRLAGGEVDGYPGPSADLSGAAGGGQVRLRLAAVPRLSASGSHTVGVGDDIVGRPVNAVLAPPQPEPFAVVADVDLNRLVLNVTGLNTPVLLDRDRVMLFPRSAAGGVVRAGTDGLPCSGHDAAGHGAAPAGLLTGPGHLPIPVRGHHPPARPGSSRV